MMEEKSTEVLRQAEKKKLYFFRQLSTSQLYNLFYTFFILVGFIELIFSVILIIRSV